MTGSEATVMTHDRRQMFYKARRREVSPSFIVLRQMHQRLGVLFDILLPVG